MQEDNNSPTVPPLPNSRLTNQSRSATDLTNRPIIVMGIRVHDNDPELARIMRIVIKLTIIIFILQTVSFFIILFNGGYVEEGKFVFQNFLFYNYMYTPSNIDTIISILHISLSSWNSLSTSFFTKLVRINKSRYYQEYLHLLFLECVYP